MAARRITQAQLAEAIGTDQTQISRWLNNPKKGPSLFYMLRIARALGTSVDYLIDDAMTDPAGSMLTEDEQRLLEDARLVGIAEARKRLLMARTKGPDVLTPATPAQPGPIRIIEGRRPRNLGPLPKAEDKPGDPPSGVRRKADRKN